MKSFYSVLYCALLAFAIMPLCAQSPHISVSPDGEHDQAEEAWQQATYLLHTRVIVITKAEPTVHHSCKVQSASLQQLVCKGSFVSNQRSYEMSDIAALLSPADHHDSHIVLSCVGVAAALITAGFFAGPGGLVLWPVGGIVLLGCGAMAIGDNADHGERVIYRAAGSPFLIG